MIVLAEKKMNNFESVIDSYVGGLSKTEIVILDEVLHIPNIDGSIWNLVRLNRKYGREEIEHFMDKFNSLRNTLEHSPVGYLRNFLKENFGKDYSNSIRSEEEHAHHSNAYSGESSLTGAH